MMRVFKLMVCVGAISLNLYGCGGSSSSDVMTEVTPDVTQEVAASITQLSLSIQEVSFDDKGAELRVIATNQNDETVIGLTDLEVKTLAQLVPQGASGAGNSSFWMMTYDAKKNPATVVDNQDGSYRISVPATGIDTNLSQRVTLVAGGDKSLLADGKTKVAHVELNADFNGQGQAIASERKIVSPLACQQCHTPNKPFARRHTSYLELDTCIGCHSGQKENKQWNRLIHNIHNSNQSFTDKKGNQYNGIAAQALVDNQCQKCHQGLEEFPQWQNFTRVPTMEACGSCHSDIDFKAGQGHPQQDDNANCIACHNSQWTNEVHSETQLAKEKFAFGYQLQAQMQVNADRTATLTVTILDKQQNLVDATTLVPYIYRLKASTNIGPNSPTMDYKDTDNTKLAKDGKLDKAVTVDAGKLVYTTKPLPFANGDADTAFSFIGLSLCHEQGELAPCGENIAHTGTKAALAFATYSGAAISRRQIDSVEFTSCQSCHGNSFDIHGNYILNSSMSHNIGGKAVLGVEACTACHTAAETKELEDGSLLGAIEVRVHQTHKAKASGLSIKDPNNCSQCHQQIDTTAFANKSAINTAKGLYSTPITAVCSSCHTLGSEEMFHSNDLLESYGAVVNGDKRAATDAAQLETCFSCHAPTLKDHTKVNLKQ